MNITALRTAVIVSVITGALMLVGIPGTVSPAAAAGNVTINSDNPVTNYAQVTIQFTPPVGAAQVRFCNDLPASDCSAWENTVASVPATRQWTMSTTPGQRTVTLSYRNSLGSAIAGLYKDSILLDYSLDMSFASPNGYDNQGNTGASNTANGVATDSLGRIIVVGTVDLPVAPGLPLNSTGLTVRRYLANGTLDSSFNGTGRYTYYNPSISAKCFGKGVAIGSGDAIYVVGGYDQDGVGNTDILVVKLLSNGTLDTSFKGNPLAVGGTVVYPGPGADSGNAISLQADGKIVVAGSYDDSIDGNGKQAIVLRINTDGTQDTTFGTQIGPALRTGDFIYGGTGDDAGNSLAIVNPGGSIVVGGVFDYGLGNTSAWIIRLDTNGDLDPSFGLPLDPINDPTGPKTGDIAYANTDGLGAALDSTAPMPLPWTPAGASSWSAPSTGPAATPTSGC